jgi:hypothetical protein
VLLAAGTAMFPDQEDEPEFAALVDTGLSLIRGLVMAIPVWGRENVDQRWTAIRPILSRAVGDLLDDWAEGRRAA